MLRFSSYLLLCSLILLFASCGLAPDSKGGREEGNKGKLRLEETRGSLRILHGDKPVLEYRIAANMPDELPAYYERTGFLHPIHSPSGRVVSDDFPVGHSHQNGFFSAWTNTTFRDSFVDFWNTHKELASVRHKTTEEFIDVDGYLGFRTTIVHRSNAQGWDEPILAENLTVRVHDRDDVFVWDVRGEQTNVTQDTLFLNKNLYGGLGVRGSKHWNPKDTANFLAPAKFLTSEGLTRDSANHTRPEWTAIYGDLPGGKAGMAVIPHPQNFRWPVPVRVHPEMPYLSVSPVVEEGFFIAPGATYLARYRVVVYDGETDPAIISELKWTE